MTSMEDRIDELTHTSGFNHPQRHFTHEDGSHTIIVMDIDGGDHSNPRDYDGNVATLIQNNSRCIDIDDDVAGLTEARDRFDIPTMERYLAMFRPDIAYYTDYWQAGRDSFGWGYVTHEAMEQHGGDDPKRAFDIEVDLYRQWAEGEVYGAYHLTQGKPIVTYGEHGAYVDDWEVDEDSCWGFLGYDDLKDITLQFTDSPVVTDQWL